MNFEEMKSNWQSSSSSGKSQQELWLMTQIKNHPKLHRMRIQLVLEIVLLLVFLFVYYDAFDGAEKPFWANALLVGAIILFVLNDCMGWLTLRNPIKQGNLAESVKAFYHSLQRLRLFSVSSSVIYGVSLLVFFSTRIDFAHGKYLILGAMIATMFVFMWLSVLNWNRRIHPIRDLIDEFENGVGEE